MLSADPAFVSWGLTATATAVAAGGLAAAGFVHVIYKNFDLTVFMNGILGGVGSITAGADLMGITDAILIGALGGVIVVLAVSLLDKLKLDDPVGEAVPIGENALPQKTRKCLNCIPNGRLLKPSVKNLTRVINF